MPDNPTIKDVAKAAGVSMATVSNIINDRTHVKSEKVKRVHAAIKALGYRPDNGARSLKTNKTHIVGVVLPNISDRMYAHIYQGAEQILGQRGYQAILYTTSDLPAKEVHIVDVALRQRADGLLFVTCRPDAVKSFRLLEDKGVKTVFLKREPAESDFAFVEFDNRASIRDAVAHLVGDGLHNILLVTGPLENSDERQCLAAFEEAAREFGDARLGESLEANNGREGAFQAFAERLALERLPEAVIVTSSAMLEGVVKAAELVRRKEAAGIRYVLLAEDSWADGANGRVERIGQNAMRMGELAAEILLERLANPTTHEKAYRRLPNTPLHSNAPATERAAKRAERGGGKKLRALMFESPASYATRLLLSGFEEERGVRVEMETCDSKTLYRTIADAETRRRYDVFQIDQPWIAEISREGWLASLDGALAENPDAVGHFEPGVLDAYTYVDGTAYALPYKFGTQLLFYRKDLFDSPTLKASYRERTGSVLRPPRTWEEYNCVARFFSAKHNPESPVPYGTTLGSGSPIAACCEYLPRLWAYGGRVMDGDGNFAFDRREAVQALENYRDCFSYAQPGAFNAWWDEEAQCFARGEAAMMVLFVAHVGVVIDRARSRVVGRVGYGQAPGGSPLLGGWSLAIQAESRRFSEAFAFIRWATSQRLAIPQTLLGGTTASVTLYRNSELIPLYPWLPEVLESLARSRRREVNKTTTRGRISELRFEEILGGAIRRAVAGEIGPAAALADAHAALSDLLR